MHQVKEFKKGDIIYQEGTPIHYIYVIQSGRVSLSVKKSDKVIELYQAINPQTLGEEALFGQTKYLNTAEAKSSVQVLVVPAKILAAQLQKSNQVIQILLNSLVEKSKKFSAEIKDMKADVDTTPCPQEITASIFGSIFHTVHYKGKEENEKTKIDWVSLKKYSQRIFNLSPVKCENAVFCIVRAGLAEIEMIKDPLSPDGEEIIGYIHFDKPQILEDFAEFYQNYFFKGVPQDFLKADEKITKTVEFLLKTTEDARTDRNGTCMASFMDTMEKMKKYLGPSFDVNKLMMVEQKGLMMSRQSSESGGTISFIRSEYENYLQYAKILTQIETWNAEGTIDPFQVEEEVAVDDFTKCPSCAASTQPEQKFCGECGFNLIEARKSA